MMICPRCWERAMWLTADGVCSLCATEDPRIAATDDRGDDRDGPEHWTGQPI